MVTIADIVDGTPEGAEAIKYALERSCEDQMKIVNEALKEKERRKNEI